MRDLQNQQPTECETPEDYAALHEGAALVELGHRALLGLSGKDPSAPTGLLAAILTNDLPSQEDLGVYGLLLDAKGHIRTDLRVLKRGGGTLLAEAEPAGAEAAREILGSYAPFSRVKVEELSASEERPWSVLGVYGPRAAEALANLLGDVPPLTEHQTTEITPPGFESPLLVAGVSRPVAGYDLIGPSIALREARERLLEAGVAIASLESYEAARIESRVPRFGADLTPDNFPGEAGILDRAVSFSKGCYPGQETVARMHYRGHPNRALYRLSVEGGSPEPGYRITQDGKEVGNITSLSPLGDGAALGYLHRKADTTAPLCVGVSQVRVVEETTISH